MPNTLDSTGLTIKTLPEVLGDIESDQQSLINPDIDTSTETPLGQINGIFAGAISEVLELIQEIYNSQVPANAVNVTLENLAALTGTRRFYAAPTIVTATINVDSGFTAAAGTMFAHKSGDPNLRFTNRAAVNNTLSVAANVSVEFEATENGPTEILTGQLNTIADPLTGWNSITNPADQKTLGRDTETDAELRSRRERDLAKGGDTTVDAIRTAIVDEVQGILEIEVVENDTLVTDSRGIPGKAFEVLVRGGDDTEIAEVILERKAAGIQAYGTTTVEVNDDQGNPHTIGLSRPASVNIYIEVSLEIFPSTYGGDSSIQDAIEQWYTDNVVQGLDVTRSRISAICMGEPGIKLVTHAHTGLTALTTDVDQQIDHRQIAEVDSVRINVLTADASEP